MEPTAPVDPPAAPQRAPRAATLAARAHAAWVSHTPHAAHTFAAARRVILADDGPTAGAVVGVYGSGKSTLLFALLRDALAAGHAAVWDEAAALFARLLPDDEPVLPQEFAARVLTWLDAVASAGAARAHYHAALAARGRDDVVAVLDAAQPTGPNAAPRLVLLLDEVEQAHQLLLRRVASDDGQPLRALIDACGPRLRLLLAYAPESFHSLGDADRGRLVRLGLPAIDVASIQATWQLPRGSANFAWWVSRGRARGVAQAVQSVLEPARAGLFDADLHALGDALDGLPGVFGVPALLRDGVGHERLRALLDLQPLPTTPDSAVGGVTVSLADRHALADRVAHELRRRLGDCDGLDAIANELVAVLEACAGDDERCYLTLDDFVATLRLAEARAIEGGRVRDPVDGLAEHGARIFDSLGALGPLARRLPLSLRELAEERCPSPFTDPYLPLADGRVPSEGELQRAFAPLASRPGPILEDREAGFALFADHDQLAAYLARQLADGGAPRLRALVLDGSRPPAPVIDLAVYAGRLAWATIGRFHATFVRCLAVRAGAASDGTSWEAAATAGRTDRQLARKIGWHRERLLTLVRELQPRPDPTWSAAASYLRQCEPFRTTLARLDRDSPALLGLLVPLRPLPPAARALAVRAVALLGDGTPLRRLAREANPGGRLSGAAVALDALLPGPTRQPRWTEVPQPGAAALAEVLDRFAHPLGVGAAAAGGAAWTDASARVLAALLFAEDRHRMEAMVRYAAGALPAIDRERDALGALQRLDETARRADAVVADLERCVGRREGNLGALRLGNFVDQVRQHGGPVDALRQLVADVEASPADGPAAWLRALLLWLVGVFAARLLQGVERDQVALAAWQRLAAVGADVGRRCDEVVTVATALGAERVVELLRHRRMRLSNLLDEPTAASHAIDELGAWVDALGPLLAELQAAQRALAAQGATLELALASYLPDPDAIPHHIAQLRRLPETLAELGDQLPRPGEDGLPAWLDGMRRRAEGSRRERARLALEDALGIVLPAAFDALPDDVEAASAAWARLPVAARPALAATLEAAAPGTGPQLARAIAACADKRDVTATWCAPPHPALAALDAAITARCDDLRVSLDDVRAWSKARTRALAIARDLDAALPGGAALTALVEAVRGDGGDQLSGAAWSTLADRARSGCDRVAAARERYARVVGDYPAATPASDDVEAAIAAIDAQCQARQVELASAVTALRATARALEGLGERPTPIPPALALTMATRLLERERGRLAHAIGRRRERLVALLAGHGLPASLAPGLEAAEEADLTRCDALLAEAEARLQGLRGDLAAAATLGIAAADGDLTEDGLAGGWDDVATQLRERVAAAQQARYALRRRYEELAARCARLGGSLERVASAEPTLAAAQTLVAAAERQLAALRETRLAGATPQARALYQAIASGSPDAPLPPALAELVALGLVHTVEAPR